MGESHIFFGRSRAINDLLGKLSSFRFIAVLGNSGCGKSSLVRAGLTPTLMAGFLVGDSNRWRVAVMRPGHSPLDNLAISLLHAFDEAVTDERAQELVKEVARSGAHALANRLAAWTKETPANILLLVDQFEEIFRFAAYKEEAEPGEAERRRHEAADFVSIMLELASQESLPVFVVMTMRSDFFGECVAFPGLPEAMNQGQYLLPRLTREERREAVENPARLYGGAVSPRLLDRVLNDMTEELDDQLPLMQHAMRRTWEHARTTHGEGEGLALDLPDYESVGGVRRSLSFQAEEVFGQFDQRSQFIAEKMFRLMCEMERQGYLVRRVVRVAEVEAVAEASTDEVRMVAVAFSSDSGGGLLMPPPFVQLTPETILDISHEALLRNWDRLRSWAEAEAASAKMYLRIEGEARMHAEGNSALLRGPRLQMILNWLDGERPTAAWAARYGQDFGLNMEFISLSRKTQEEELRRAEDELRRVQTESQSGRVRRKKKIFISYRRTDNPDAAERIYDRLKRHFGKGAIFYDLDSIAYGEDFERVIEAAVKECGVLLAVIGKDWVAAFRDRMTDTDKLRPQDSTDFVKTEIETALDAGVQIIPVLVGPRRRDPMPRGEELPDSIRQLAKLNYAEIFSGQDFNGRVADLIKQIEQTVGPVGTLSRLFNRLSAQS